MRRQAAQIEGARAAAHASPDELKKYLRSLETAGSHEAAKAKRGSSDLAKAVRNMTMMGRPLPPAAAPRPGAGIRAPGLSPSPSPGGGES